MSKLIQDGIYAWRRLRRSPGFTVAALLTLALGIGANALIFSVVNAVFLRPLSYANADRLVWVTEFFPKFNRWMVPAPDYAAWKRQSVLFERLEAMTGSFGENVAVSGSPAERAQVGHVTPGFFAMVGMLPRIGAGFVEDEGAAERPAVLVSDGFWRGYLHADPAITGKTVTLNAKAYSVVGVMPRGYVDLDGPDVALWVADAVLPGTVLRGKNPRSVRLIGRLKSGVTLEQARIELERVARSLDAQYPAPWGAYHSAAAVR